MGAGEWRQQMGKIIATLMERKEAHDFLAPVDWRFLQLLDYPQIVKRPMDLGTVRQKLENGEYRGPSECAADIRLIWDNCQLYNKEGSYHHDAAQALSKRFEKMYEKARTAAAAASAASAAATAAAAAASPSDHRGAGTSGSFAPATQGVSSKDGSSGGGGAAFSAKRPPSTEERIRLCHALYKLRRSQAGKVVVWLDQRCPEAVEHVAGDQLELNLDAVDPPTFRKVSRMVSDMLSEGSSGGGGGAGKSKKRRKDVAEDGGGDHGSQRPRKPKVAA